MLSLCSVFAVLFFSLWTLIGDIPSHLVYDIIIMAINVHTLEATMLTKSVSIFMLYIKKRRGRGNKNRKGKEWKCFPHSFFFHLFFSLFFTPKQTTMLDSSLDRRSCARTQRSTLLKEYHSCQFISNAYIISDAVDFNAIIAGEWKISEKKINNKFCIQHVMADGRSDGVCVLLVMALMQTKASS